MSEEPFQDNPAREEAANLSRCIAALEEELRRARSAEAMLQSALDVLSANIAVLDEEGVILRVNRAWRHFAEEKGGAPEQVSKGTNYLAIAEADEAAGCAERIRAVLRGDSEAFTTEYPCGSTVEPRWFSMRVTRLPGTGPARAVVAHEEITGFRREAITAQGTTQRYKQIFDHELDAVMVFDLETLQCEEANNAALRLYGYTHEEFLARTAPEVSAEPEASKQSIADIAKGAVPGAVPLRYHRKKDGTVFPVEIASTTFVSEGRTKVIGAVRDISARLKMEESLRFQDEILAQVLEGVIMVRASDGTIAHANTRFEFMFGYEPGELTGMPVSVLNDPGHGDPEAVAREIIEHLANRGHWEGDLPNVRKDGSPFWTHSTISKFTHSTYGECIFSVQYDITERKRAEEALRQANAELEERVAARTAALLKSERAERERATELAALLDAIPAPVFIAHDPEAATITGNRTAEELFRSPRGSEISLGAGPDTRPIHFRVYENGRELSPEEMPAQRAARGEHIKGMELTVRFDDGTAVEAVSHAVPICDGDGVPRGSISTLMDITEHKRTEAALRENEARLRLLSARLVDAQEAERRRIASELHDEVGQVLTGLKLLLASVARTCAADCKSPVTEARQVTEHLIGQVRDMSLSLRPRMLDDLGLLPALLWHFERYTAQTGIQVDFRHSGLEQRFPPPIETAAYRIVQEGLTNVARHARVETAIVALVLEEDTIHLTVEDNGVGFASPESVDSGTQYGLAGMFERAASLGGTFSVVSAPNQGTCLTASIPIRPSLKE